MIGAVKFPDTVVQNEPLSRVAGQNADPGTGSAAAGNPASAGSDYTGGYNAGFDQYIPGITRNAAQNNQTRVRDTNQSGDSQSSIPCQT